MKTKYLIKLSMIIDKMEIKDEIVNIETTDNKEVAKKILSAFISKIYKAENEIYQLIAEMKDISVDEAKELDIFAFIKELLETNIDSNSIKDFL